MADSKRFDYERSEVGLRLVGCLAAGLATFVVITPLALPFAFPSSASRITPASRPALRSNAPPLEVTPGAALRQSRQGEARIARGYGWVDRDHGQVRIPIDRAIEILLRKGLPGWPSP
ncbi:hypothetical protein JQ543_05585 [Bradyrhizobium diazoefficiens]|nr:hypothetical protein [Bradyrhizobium diazoefficiens]MBR0777873.1 hypothetical protein [Bradyrhizobium diazoefficiens]MBR0847211.1 hypothetical protein [Bradyrhizobium diazoefficiens]